MEEKDNVETGDLVPIVYEPTEVNTYDLPEIAYTEDAFDTQCFNTKRKKRRLKLSFYKIYSFLSISILLITLIFAAPEILEFIMDDLGTEDMFVRRIFGYGAIINGDKYDFYQMILDQSFADLSIDKNKNSEPPKPNSPPTAEVPESSAQSSSLQTPSETPPTSSPTITDKIPVSSPTPTTPVITPSPTPPPANSKPIISMDMSLLSYGAYYIYNNTSLTPNTEKLANATINTHYDPSSDAPLVLVVHTHTTEAYMPEGATYYIDEGELARSKDASENMIAVGVEFARVLNENGINTIHCTVVHDAESYLMSYQRSAETIEKYLKEYPSIKYVFDLHRDSLMRSNGELISAATSINGTDCAQIMPVVSNGFDGWESNFTLALKLRQKLNGDYTNLCRPVCLRESLYNQNLAPVSLLLEIGTSGNSLSQAKSAAALVAEALAELIKG